MKIFNEDLIMKIRLLWKNCFLILQIVLLILGIWDQWYRLTQQGALSIIETVHMRKCRSCRGAARQKGRCIPLL